MGRKGILIVHGMGTPAKNSLLVTIVNSIADWVANNSKSGATPELDLNIKGPSEDPECDTPSTITLRHKDEEWVFREVWWARLVDAPRYDPMIGWTVVRACTHFSRLAVLTYENGLFPVLLGMALLIFLSGFIVVVLVFFTILLISIVFLFPFAAVLILLGPVTRKTRQIFSTSLAVIFSLASTFAAIGLGLSLFLDYELLDTLTPFIISLVAGVLVSAVPEIWSAYRRWRRVRSIRRTTQLLAYIQRLRASSAAEPRYRLGTFDDYIGSLARGTERPRYSTILNWPRILGISAGQPAIALSRTIVRRMFRLTYSSTRTSNPGEQVLADELRSSKNRFWRLMLMGILPFFHFFNSLITLWIYVTGIIFVPMLMLAVWILSRFRGIPGVPRALRAVSNRIDQFLVGSLGDIKIYMDEPVQATRIRNELLKSIEELGEDCPGGVFLVCHSTGAAIAFETIVLPENKPKLKNIKTLIMVGSIMNMVWKMGTRRRSFDRAIPSGIRLVNIFTRYDPAFAGPLESTPSVVKHRKIGKLTEFEVSNEDDLFRDHSAYWTNSHQVIPLIIREIIGSKSRSRDAEVRKEFLMKRRDVASRISRRKWQILLLSLPRLAVWYSFPGIMVWQFLTIDGVGSGTNIPSVFNWLRIDRYLGLNVSFLAEPASTGQFIFGVIFASFGLTLILYLLYGLARTVLWDGVARELRIFSPHLQPLTR